MMSIVGLIGNNFDAFLMPPAIFLSLYSPQRRKMMEDRMWEIHGPGKAGGETIKKPEIILREQPKWKIYAAWTSVVVCFTMLLVCGTGLILYLAGVKDGPNVHAVVNATGV